MSVVRVCQVRFAVPALVVAVAFLGAPPAAAQAAPHCTAGQAPQFVLGFAQLQQRIGATMGNPLECEHTDPGSGDTQQHTSTGLAYVPHNAGLVSFTSGWEHYALDGGQVDLWRNASVDAPRPRAQDRTYLDDNAALRGRVDQLDTDLTGFLHQGQAGNLDAVDFGTLGSDVDELQMLRATFAAAPGPASLSAFTDGWLQAQDADIGAGEALLQARLDSDPSNVEADLNAAMTELLRRDQLRSSAAFALSEVFSVAYH
ncbi:MAG: hypothetical protein M3069_17985 [Chloroflexota bacterium]|nr:hypothetical protein [Chloroflexota bacterium]